MTCSAAGFEDGGGRAGPIRDAAEVEEDLVLGVGDGGDDRLLHPSAPCTRVPGSVENVERAWIRDILVAGRLDGAKHQHLRSDADISSISSYDTRSSLRASGLIRGSAVKTPSTSR